MGDWLGTGTVATFRRKYRRFEDARAFAGNQVEAFAVAKGSGLLFTGPLAAFFIPRQWDLLLGILPTYWPVKAYFTAIEGPPELFWVAVALSVVYPSACAVFLYRLFRRRSMAG